MSQREITYSIFVCDLCGNQQPFDNLGGWTKYDPSLERKEACHYQDWCSSCSDSFIKWRISRNKND